MRQAAWLSSDLAGAAICSSNNSARTIMRAREPGGVACERLGGRRHLQLEQLGEGDHAVEEAGGQGHVVVGDQQPVGAGAADQLVQILELAALEVLERAEPVLDAVVLALELWQL